MEDNAKLSKNTLPFFKKSIIFSPVVYESTLFSIPSLKVDIDSLLIFASVRPPSMVPFCCLFCISLTTKFHFIHVSSSVNSIIHLFFINFCLNFLNCTLNWILLWSNHYECTYFLHMVFHGPLSFLAKIIKKKSTVYKGFLKFSFLYSIFCFYLCTFKVCLFSSHTEILYPLYSD